MLPARLDHLEPGAEPGFVRGPQPIDIDADAVADPARAPAPVAQRDGDRRVGLTRHDPGRNLHCPPALAELDNVLLLDPQPARQGRADQGGVVPGQARQRLGQFLEPGVVGESAVPDGRVGPEDDLQASALVAARGAGLGMSLPRGATALGFPRRAGDHARAEGLVPGRLEVARERLAPPVVADDLQARPAGLAQENAPAPR